MLIFLEHDDVRPGMCYQYLDPEDDRLGQKLGSIKQILAQMKQHV